jgi:SHS2 domain-containing protein
MMDDREFGFTEIPHTADWALKVWAPNLSILFAQAAQGMYWLTETHLHTSPRVEQQIELDGVDAESLLVSFLSELLYFGESDGMGFDQFAVTVNETHLRAAVSGAPIAEQRKEIKAVTYHNLAIQETPQGLEVTIVFDV